MGQITRRWTLCWWVEEAPVRGSPGLCQPTGPMKLPWAGPHISGSMRAWGRRARKRRRGHMGMRAHGVMPLHYNIGTHYSQPHSRSSGGVLVPHEALRDAYRVRQYPTWSWRRKRPKWIWVSRAPGISTPPSWHQTSDSEIGSCEGCKVRSASLPGKSDFQ